MKAARLIAIAALLAAGCDQRSPEAIASASGLSMPGTDIGEVSANIPPPEGSLLADLQAVVRQQGPVNYPKMPDPAPPLEVTYKNYGVRYPGWETDRIDATSFDALASSLNAIIAKMPPGIGQDFDKVVKYVLLQVTKDPMVAKKAVIGDRVSDRELLSMVSSYLDGRTPAEIVVLAEQMKLREDKSSGGQPTKPDIPLQPMGGAGLPPGF